jgi:hypothetical protein
LPGIGLLPLRTATDRHPRPFQFPTAVEGNNYVYAWFTQADAERIRAFAAAHPEVKYFGLRFETTPVEPEPGGIRDAAIVFVFQLSDLSSGYDIPLTRAMREEATGLMLKLVGQ